MADQHTCPHECEDCRDAREWHEIAYWTWVYDETDDSGETVLHAPDGLDVGDWHGRGQVLCGDTSDFWAIPGFLTRMSEHVLRCEFCCEAKGYPAGAMSPKNDDACRSVMEADA